VSVLFPDVLDRHLPYADAPAEYRPPTVFPDLTSAKRISVDLELHDPDLQKKGPGVRRDGYIVGVSVQADDKNGRYDGYREYYPMHHEVGMNCDPDKVMDYLRDQLNHFKGEIVGANVALCDGDYLQAEGIKPPGKWRDVQWAEALIDEHADSYSLETLSQKYIGTGKVTEELMRLYGPEYKLHFREMHPAHVRTYGLGDVLNPLQILDEQEKILKKENLTKLYDIECRLTPLLLYMRATGVKVDLEHAAKLEKKLATLYSEALDKLMNMVGFAVNPDASADLVRAFDTLHIKYPFTEKGNPSFKKDFLKTVDHPFAKLLIDAKGYEKLRGTFVEGYILNGHINGRVHCQFHPLRRATDDEGEEHGTVSGRFSSSNPNLQNIPTRTELGKEIRACFIPDEGCNWFAYDYSQIEYRNLVHFAVVADCDGAEIAQQMYHDDPDTDFHQMVSELTGLERGDAKNLNFGLVYGMGLLKLARALNQVWTIWDELAGLGIAGQPNTKALEIMETYHGKAPFIKELYTMAMNRAANIGFVKTILGRRSRFTEWERDVWEKGLSPFPARYIKREDAVAAFGEHIRRSHTHKALNCILQGSAADMMKVAMVLIWESGLIFEGGPVSIGITVHDELDGSVEPGEAGDKSRKEIQEIMMNAIPLEVPVYVDGGIGRSWAEAK